jgi:hypothetical protein
MIQRKQTLFLLQAIFCSIALLFIPVQQHTSAQGVYSLDLMPGGGNDHNSASYAVAVLLNMVLAVLATATIFLYQKRALQITLCKVMAFLWLALTGMLLFCPLFTLAESESISHLYFAGAIGFFAILAHWMAIRLIQKDIDLLKSADRIR